MKSRYQAPNLSFDYPASWALDATPPGIDSSLFARLRPSRHAYIEIVVYTATDPIEVVLEEAVDRHIRRLKSSTKRSELNKWQGLNGVGVQLAGKVQRTDFLLTIFEAPIEHQDAFEITAFRPAKDEHRLESGFKTITDSLQFIQF